MFVVIGVAYSTKEFYPLSSFPMYSKFDEKTYYVYPRHAETGEAIPTVRLQIVASDLKKHYLGELDELDEQHDHSHYEWSIEQRRPAGEATLTMLRDEWLPDRAPDVLATGELQQVELVDVRVVLKDGKLTKREEVVGSLNFSK